MTGAPPSGTIELIHHYVRDLSFEHPNAPHSLIRAKDAVPFIDVQITYRQIDGEHFEALLSITGSVKADDMVVAIVELSYAGIYRFSAMPAELCESFLMVEAPRELFPFARALIALVTLSAGVPPLMIVPPNFQDTYRRMNEQRLLDQKAS
jgi:preprotein translocase subunit SecB